MIIQQLTNNDYDEVVFLSSIRNDNIFWEDDDGYDTEIYFYDGNNIVQLSNNNFDDKITEVPIYSDTNDIIWTTEVSDDHGTYSGIYSYDGEKTIQITDNIYGSIVEVYVTENRIIWITDTYTDSGRESNIYKYDQEKTTKITENNFYGSIDQLQIFDDHIFWVAKDSNDDSQLYKYDGESVNQLTDNDSTDPVPDIYFISEVKINESNGDIVWVSGKQSTIGGPPHYSDVAIYLYNGEKIRQITDDNFSAYSYNNLQFIGSNIVWIASSHPGNPSDEIFLYNGEEIIQIAENDFNESISELHLLGDNLFWVSSEIEQSEGVFSVRNTRVYLYNGNEVITLIDNNFENIYSSIVGDNIVFTCYNGDRVETYLYKNNEITSLGSRDGLEIFTYTDNGIVWFDADTIQFYNGIEVIEITDNYFNDIQYLEIFDKSVVWAGKKDGDYEVYLYDGTGIIQLTNDNIDNFPRLVGDKYIVWNANDGNDDEIYLYDINKNQNQDITYLEIDSLTTPIYRFQNTQQSGTYLFVGEEERQSIIASYPNFTEEGEAFKVAIAPDDDLIVINRFQNKDVLGTYLYAGEEESINIRANYSNFVEEGVAFYVYDANAGKGVDFYRFQNTQIPGTYIFVGEEERQNIIANYPNFIEEGVAFEVLV